MKRFIAALVCALLCVQPVLAQRVTRAEGEITQVIQETVGENTENLSDETTTKEENTQVTQENIEATEGKAEATEGKAEATEGKAETAGIEISAPSALLMEASTGQVIYEKDADSKRPPASVTKIMTLLLIFD